MKGLGRQWCHLHCGTIMLLSILSVMKSLVPLAAFFLSSQEFHWFTTTIFSHPLFFSFSIYSLLLGIFPVDNYHILSSRGLACASYFGEAGRYAFPATVAYVSQFLWLRPYNVPVAIIASYDHVQYAQNSSSSSYYCPLFHEETIMSAMAPFAYLNLNLGVLTASFVLAQQKFECSPSSHTCCLLSSS